MTHDELLAKIKREENYLKTQMYDGNAIGGFVVTSVLRAVVELHKPISYPSTSGLPLECTVCRAEPYYSTNEVYPCPTIQAIEKELK